ncbi:unnamed protein product, partial [Phaeothamnion confervicola]
MFRGPVVCLGFGLQHDMSVLRRSYPAMRCFDGADAVLDVGELRDGSADGTDEAGDGGNAGGGNPGSGGCSGGNSLSDVCRIWLGRGLDKTEQLSDWSRRPLTPRQLEYAALDAHCLVSVFSTLLER